MQKLQNQNTNCFATLKHLLCYYFKVRENYATHVFPKPLAVEINQHMAFHQDFLLTSTLTFAILQQTGVRCGHESKVPEKKRKGHSCQPHTTVATLL